MSEFDCGDGPPNCNNCVLY